MISSINARKPGVSEKSTFITWRCQIYIKLISYA